MSVDKIETLTLQIINHVHTETVYHTATGSYSAEEDIAGWKWDVRTPEAEDTPRSRGDHWLGGHVSGLKDGTKLSQWQSGVVEGVE